MTDMAVLARTAGGPEVLEWTALDTAPPSITANETVLAKDFRVMVFPPVIYFNCYLSLACPKLNAKTGRVSNMS